MVAAPDVVVCFLAALAQNMLLIATSTVVYIYIYIYYPGYPGQYIYRPGCGLYFPGCG